MNDETTSGAVDISKLRAFLPELEALAQEKADATLKFSAAVDAAAFQCHVEKAVLREVVRALVNDKADEAAEKATSVADLLQAIG